MTIKNVVKMGNKQLATPSKPVINFTDGELQELLQDMQDTMNEKGGVGIAAPQIGCNLRVIMFGFEHSQRYPNEKPVSFTILINPTIESASEEMVDGWEGCLSVPGLRGLVPRHQRIHYSAYDVHGKSVSGVAEGFHARIIQHECDHIDGILFPRRIANMEFFGFEDQLFR
jgi:peptide deformylase